MPKASFNFRILCGLVLGTVSSSSRRMFAALDADDDDDGC